MFAEGRGFSMMRLLICKWNNLAQCLKLLSFQEKSKPFVVTRTLCDLFQIMNKVYIECIWDLRQGCAVYPACLENFVFLGNISCYYYLSQINKNGLFFQMSSKSIKYIFSHQKLQRCTPSVEKYIHFITFRRVTNPVAS